MRNESGPLKNQEGQYQRYMAHQGKSQQPKSQQPKSQQAQGKQTRGKQTQGKQTQGKQPQGQQPQGQQPQGNQPKGKKGNKTQGNPTNKNSQIPNKQNQPPKQAPVAKAKKGPAGVPKNTTPVYKARNPLSTNVPGPPKPEPTAEYLALAKQLPLLLPSPRKLLVILDLNGALLVRPSRLTPHVSRLRPGVSNLMPFLFATCSVMIYSSARPENVEAMAQSIIPKTHPDPAHAFVAVWARDKLDLTPEQYNEKVQVYKRLEKVWADPIVQQSAPYGNPWDQTNTVLVDDSGLKAAAQPHNLVWVPEFSALHTLTEAENFAEQDIVATLKAQIELLQWCNNVSGQIRRWQMGEIPLPALGKHKFRLVPSEPDRAQFARTNYQRVLSAVPQRMPLREVKGVQKKMGVKVELGNDDDDEDMGGVSLSGWGTQDQGRRTSMGGLDQGKRRSMAGLDLG